MIAIDLCQHGFMPGYEVWVFLGELVTQAVEREEEDCSIGVDWMGFLNLYNQRLPRILLQLRLKCFQASQSDPPYFHHLTYGH
jgi:hypothetical protein